MTRSRAKFIQILLIGLLLRLLVMPFFAHRDLVSFYTKAYWAAQEGTFIAGSFGFLWLLFHAGVLKLYSIIGLDLNSFFFSNQSTMYPYFDQIFSSLYSLKFIFLLKIPFLLIEFLSLAWLLQLFKRPSQHIQLAIAWMFNPFIIYALYLHGRNEAIPIFFLIGCFWFLQKNKPSVASFLLGFAFSVRVYPIIFLPLLMSRYLKQKTKSILILLSFLLPVWGNFYLSHLLGSPLITKIQKIPLISEIFLPVKIPLSFGQNLYLLPLIMTLIYLVFHLQLRNSLRNYWLTSFLLILVLLNLSFFHPQYLSWLTIFMVYTWVKFPKIRQRLFWAYLVQSIGWGLTLFYWGKGTTIGLLQPTNYYLVNNFGSPLILLNQLAPTIDLISLGRSLFFGASLYLSLQLYQLLQTRD